ncbi:molybdopterin-synthase adenylyltransferase MoeB [Vicingus serpentipes]|uniref:Molybdopterin-synthase adenylyltransferase n=1 Tax=Vicingus serpentipes TaxID=1926625 RepID=A0A5C6RWU0_9FLAO|nr:molybdopterin-synthase adenylyltransferase MoeB [Vicingus serpentipes]TXB66771.1 molybdopterin-synthase adenylyltransferase MoeB [Vicingus serpentipes]
MLSDKEKYRYSRHLLLDKVGDKGQEKLKFAKVLVVGAGGLGCPVLQYLTAAGVGTIGIIDFDTVDETNLQRQVLFSIQDIGTNKALAAKNRLEQLNQFIVFNIYQEKLTVKNVLELFCQYDIIVDGTDNFSTRYLVNDACIKTNKPFVYGAIYKFEGQVSVFNYGDGPSYRCLFPNAPDECSVSNCSEIGVLGVLPGLIGTQQANEVLKLILNIGNPLSGKLAIYNALEASQLIIEISRNEDQINIAKQIDFDLYDYDYFCGIKKEKNMKEISAQELKALLKKEDIQVIDVRESYETPKIEELKALNIPMQSIPHNMDKIDRNKKVVIHCQHGIRSMHAIDFLAQNGFDNLINLTGGIVMWED